MSKLEKIIQDNTRLGEKQRVMQAITFAAAVIEANYAEVLKPYNLTPPQYQVLRVLLTAYPGTLTILQIREEIHDRQTDVPRMIKRLTKLKFTKQTRPAKGHGKQHSVSLTEHGYDTLDRVARQIDLKRPVEEITMAEAKELNRLLLKILKFERPPVTKLTAET